MVVPCLNEPETLPSSVDKALVSLEGFGDREEVLVCGLEQSGPARKTGGHPAGRYAGGEVANKASSSFRPEIEPIS
jgi:hypothetical protein